MTKSTKEKPDVAEGASGKLGQALSELTLVVRSCGRCTRPKRTKTPLMMLTSVPSFPTGFLRKTGSKPNPACAGLSISGYTARSNPILIRPGSLTMRKS